MYFLSGLPEAWKSTFGVKWVGLNSTGISILSCKLHSTGKIADSLHARQTKVKCA